MMENRKEEGRKRSPVHQVPDLSKRQKGCGQFRLKQLTGYPHSFTRTNDEIHQTIDLCPVMKVLTDTKQMQRLRKIQQL